MRDYKSDFDALIARADELIGETRKMAAASASKEASADAAVDAATAELLNTAGSLRAEIAKIANARAQKVAAVRHMFKIGSRLIAAG